MAKTALVPVADGSEEIEVVCIVDTLRRAGVDVTVASVMRRRQITASRQTVLVADCLLKTTAASPLTWSCSPAVCRVPNFRDDHDVCALLTGQRAAGRTIGAICAAPAAGPAATGVAEWVPRDLLSKLSTSTTRSRGRYCTRGARRRRSGSDYEPRTGHRHRVHTCTRWAPPQHGGRRNYRPTHAGEITYRCQ